MDTSNKFAELLTILEIEDQVNSNTSGISLEDDIPDVLEVLIGAIDTVYDYVSEAICQYYSAQIESKRLNLNTYVPGINCVGFKFKTGHSKWTNLLVAEGSRGDVLFYSSAFTGHEDTSLGSDIRRFDAVEMYDIKGKRMLPPGGVSSKRRVVDELAKEAPYTRLKAVFGKVLGGRTYLRLTSSAFSNNDSDHTAIINVRDPEATGYLYDVNIESNFTPVLGLLHSNVIITHRFKSMTLSELARRSVQYQKAELKGCSPDDQLTYTIQGRIYKELLDMLGETPFGTVDCIVPIIEFKVLNSMISNTLDADQAFASAALATSKRASLVYAHGDKEIYIRGPKELVTRTLHRSELVLPKLATFSKSIKTASETVLNDSSIFGIIVTSDREDPGYGYVKLGAFERLNYRWDKKAKTPYLELRNNQGDVIGIIPEAGFISNGVIKRESGTTYTLINMSLSTLPEVVSIKSNGLEVPLEGKVIHPHWEDVPDAKTGVQLLKFNETGVSTISQGSISQTAGGVAYDDTRITLY